MIIPVPIYLIQLPELPSKNFKAEKVIEERIKNWYKAYPHGHFDVLPSSYEYYEYATIPEGKILFQIIRKSEDASFLEGNYEEELIFFMGEKDYGWFPPIQYFHFEKWWKPVCYEWAARYEIPVEIMEDAFNIPFREQWKERNLWRKQKYKEYEEHIEAIAKISPFI